jgi:hypothetical protein
MDTSNCKEQPRKKEDVARRKVVKEEEPGSRKSSTISVNSGSGTDYQFIYHLDGPLGEGNI